eukprot:3915272-Alexandrium_andersonii.AAC.1
MGTASPPMSVRLQRTVQYVHAFTRSPSEGSLQTWRSTKTLQSLGLGLQTASSTRPSFRRASRQSCRPSRTSRSRKTSMSVAGLRTRSKTSPRCAGS